MLMNNVNVKDSAIPSLLRVSTSLSSCACYKLRWGSQRLFVTKDDLCLTLSGEPVSPEENLLCARWFVSCCKCRHETFDSCRTVTVSPSSSSGIFQVHLRSPRHVVSFSRPRSPPHPPPPPLPTVPAVGRTNHPQRRWNSCPSFPGFVPGTMRKSHDLKWERASADSEGH